MEVVTDIQGQLSKWPIGLVIVLATVVVGLVLRKSAGLPDRVVLPIVTGLNAGLFSALGNPGQISYQNHHPRVTLGFYGLICGFIAWCGHRWILTRAQKVLPKGFFPEATFNTQQFTKDPKPVDKPDPNPNNPPEVPSKDP